MIWRAMIQSQVFKMIVSSEIWVVTAEWYHLMVILTVLVLSWVKLSFETTELQHC